jgi:hypothetical protein
MPGLGNINTKPSIAGVVFSSGLVTGLCREHSQSKVAESALVTARVVRVSGSALDLDHKSVAEAKNRQAPVLTNRLICREPKHDRGGNLWP